MPSAAAALGLALAGGLAGCGLGVQSADLFMLTRTGQGSRLALLVSDGGAVRCNGARGKRLSDTMLIRARDLSDNLAQDAARQLSLPGPPDTVFSYRVRLQQGTISFADRRATGRQELVQTELFAAQAAQQACGLSG
ncbi:MAG: hypothetical protein M3025_05015 [Actinomycetota bacterium]|nr:hypothetical protein [Actinomycetota bacterium]